MKSIQQTLTGKLAGDVIQCSKDVYQKNAAWYIINNIMPGNIDYDIKAFLQMLKKKKKVAVNP